MKDKAMDLNESGMLDTCPNESGCEPDSELVLESLGNMKTDRNTLDCTVDRETDKWMDDA